MSSSSYSSKINNQNHGSGSGYIVASNNNLNNFNNLNNLNKTAALDAKRSFGCALGQFQTKVQPFSQQSSNMPIRAQNNRRSMNNSRQKHKNMFSTVQNMFPSKRSSSKLTTAQMTEQFKNKQFCRTFGSTTDNWTTTANEIHLRPQSKQAHRLNNAKKQRPETSKGCRSIKTSTGVSTGNTNVSDRQFSGLNNYNQLNEKKMAQQLLRKSSAKDKMNSTALSKMGLNNLHKKNSKKSQSQENCMAVLLSDRNQHSQKIAKGKQKRSSATGQQQEECVQIIINRPNFSRKGQSVYKNKFETDLDDEFLELFAD